MAATTPRYLPKLKLYNRTKAAHRALLHDIVTSDLMGSTVLAPAKRSGITFTKLDDNKTIATLDYKIRWVDAGVNKWMRVPNGIEEVYRQNAITLLKAELATESAKNPVDVNIIDSINVSIRQLSEGGEGYLGNAWGVMDSGALGVFWRLAAPNIPVTLKSTFAIEKNRAISFRLERGLEPEGQGNDFSFTIEIGNGNTLYAIVMSNDGNNSNFIHYRNMTPKARKVLLDQRDALLDFGRVTPAEQKEIDTLTEKIKASKAAGDNGAAVAAAEAEIQRIKDKKILPSQQSQIDELENQLYIEQKPFRLQEDAQSLLGKPIDITVQFLRAGYVVIKSNESTFVYENKRLTGWRPYGYHDGLPDRSQIVIKSTGGQFALVYGHPEYKQKGVLLTQPFDVDFTPVDADLDIDADADDDGAGCSIDYVVKEYKAPKTTSMGATTNAQYQTQVTFTSDGKYTPELFNAQLHIAPPNPDSLELIWDSQVQGANTAAHSGNWIQDFLLTDDARRTRQVTAHIDNSFNKCQLPISMSGLAVDAVLHDTREDTDLPILTHGCIVSGLQADKKGFGASAEIGHRGGAVLTCIGVEGFLDRDIDAKIRGDNKYPNDYLRQFCRDAGLLESEYAGIPAGNIGLPIIERSVPGEAPAVQPEDGAKYWEFMNSFAQGHCLNWILFCDGTQLRLEKILSRDKTEHDYKLPPDVAVSDKHCLRRNISFEQSKNGFVTSVTAVGAKDPLTGKRLMHTESIPQANDKRFLNTVFYIGEEIKEVLPYDDSLTDMNAVILRARNRLQISSLTPNGLSSWLANVDIDFDVDLRAGDVRKLFGKKIVVDNVTFGSLNAGDGESMQAQFQLAEDVD